MSYSDRNLQKVLLNPVLLGSPYFGQSIPADSKRIESDTIYCLIANRCPSRFAHNSLHRLDALNSFIQAKIQHPYHEDGTILTPEEQLNLRHFSQKIDDLTAKFIVKIANHYKTARLNPSIRKLLTLMALETDHQPSNTLNTTPPNSSHKPGAGGVITLIIITVVICLLAYYFGL